jgi:putative inorganic carbon (HCO3(-)) transporter
LAAQHFSAGQSRVEAGQRPGFRVLICLVILVLVAVPLAHSGSFLHGYSLLKFLILLVAGGALAGVVTAFFSVDLAGRGPRRQLELLVLAYLVALCISTAAGVSPIISAQGSFQAFMGLSSYVCLGVLAVSIPLAVGHSEANFKLILRAITAGGLIVALVGVGQFAGIVEVDPRAGLAFGDASRIYTTLGHPDFAGSFLLYIIFASEATALLSRESRWQNISGITCVLSLIALVFTGTRGAWLGLLAGVAAAVVIAFRQRVIAIPNRRSAARLVLAGIALITILTLAIKNTSLGAPLRARITTTMQEGFTGSGRTADWKMAARMLPRYWLTGCGPDVFRLAQLPFKTDEYARATTGVDAEDPHNAYLSSLVSTGVLGFSLYITLIWWAIRCYWRGIRAATGRDQKAAGIVLLAGFIAVLVHGLFLHYIVATALYFFAFIALGPAWAEVQESLRDRSPRQSLSALSPLSSRIGRCSVLAITAVVIVGAVVYSYRLLKAEYYIERCLSAASAGDPASVVENGAVAASLPLYQTDINSYYGGALQGVSAGQPEAVRGPLLRLAIEQLNQATSRTLSPVANLAMLSLTSSETGDFESARQAALQAEHIDPHSYLPHMAWSTLYLRQRNLDGAVDEYNKAKFLGGPNANMQPLFQNLGHAVRKSDSADLWYRLTGQVLIRKDKTSKKQNLQSSSGSGSK